MYSIHCYEARKSQVQVCSFKRFCAHTISFLLILKRKSYVSFIRYSVTPPLISYYKIQYTTHHSVSMSPSRT